MYAKQRIQLYKVHKTVTSRQLLYQGEMASRRSVSIAGNLESFGTDGTKSICILYFYNVASVTDELGLNENQLATLLSLLLSSEQLLYECCLPVFDSVIIATPGVIHSALHCALHVLIVITDST